MMLISLFGIMMILWMFRFLVKCSMFLLVCVVVLIFLWLVLVVMLMCLCSLLLICIISCRVFCISVFLLMFG